MSNTHLRRWRVNGVPTAALVTGHGPPLLIIPGLGCASWMYARLAHALSNAFQVWRYDHPGHGFSSGSLGTVAALSAHAATFMQQAGLAGAPILGHSMGGEVALELAARWPQLTPALILAAPTSIPDSPTELGQLLHLLQDAPRERRALLPLALSAYARCGVPCMARLAADVQRHATLDNLGRVRQPTLVLLGGRDPVVPPVATTALQALLRSPRFRVMAAAAHALTDSHARDVAWHVRQFLQDHAAGE